jgi:hypothetical protein
MLDEFSFPNASKCGEAIDHFRNPGRLNPRMLINTIYPYYFGKVLTQEKTLGRTPKILHLGDSTPKKYNLKATKLK